MEKRSECLSSTPSYSGGFARGPSLATGRGWGPAQSLPLLHLFRPEVMSLILLLPLFPPGDRAALQSHTPFPPSCSQIHTSCVPFLLIPAFLLQCP